MQFFLKPIANVKHPYRQHGRHCTGEKQVIRLKSCLAVGAGHGKF